MATYKSQSHVIHQMELSKLWSSLNEMSIYQKQEGIEYFTHCTTLRCRRNITKDGRLYGFYTDMPKYSPLCHNQEVEGVWLSVSLYNGKLPTKSPYGNHRATFSVSDILSYMSSPPPYSDEYDEDESDESPSSTDENEDGKENSNIRNCKTEGIIRPTCNVNSDDDVNFANESNDDDKKCPNNENKFYRENLGSVNEISGHCVRNADENESESETCSKALVHDAYENNGEKDRNKNIDNKDVSTERENTTSNVAMETDLRELGNLVHLEQTCVITPLLFFECAHHFQAGDQYVRMVMVRSNDKHTKWCQNNLLEVDLKNNPFLSWDGNKVYTTRNDRSSYKNIYVEMLLVGDIVLEELENGIEWEKVGKTQRASRDPSRGIYRNAKKRF